MPRPPADAINSPGYPKAVRYRWPVTIPVPIRWRVLPALGAALVLWACGSGGTDEGDAGAETRSCGGDDHPCAFAEVPAELIERTLDLGDDVADVLAEGGTTADAAAMLDAQDGVADVVFDADAVRFRLTGGREHWVFAPSAYATRSGIGGARAQPVPHGAPAPSNVVGAGRDGKRALVLSPSLYEFGEFDEGADVAGILAATRGYEGGVTHLANGSPTDDTISFETYRNLDDYDVVHLSTHGAAVCDDDGCFSGVQAFSFASIEAALPGDTVDEKLGSITEVGVALGQDPKTGALGVLLTADFFTTHYPGGLGDSMVYVSACETMAPAGTDLVTAIRGSEGVYVGWDRTVKSDDAANAAKELHRRLGEYGYTVGDAREEIGDLATGARGATLQVSGRDEGHGLRIREVVRLLDPATGEPLVANTEIDIDGVAGDDIDDAVPWAVRVDGIEPEDAADARLRLTIDGVELSRDVAAGVRDERDGWLLEGLLDLGEDLGDDRLVEVEAVVELPEGGESSDRRSVELVGELSGSLALHVEFTHTSFREGEASEKSSGSADLVLEPDEFQRSDDEVSYHVTGGSASLDLAYESLLCIQTGPVLRWEVTEDDALGSFLTVDSSTDPPTLTASISLDGPEFVGEIACRAGTGPDAPPGYGDPEPTSFGTSPLFLSIAAEHAQPLGEDGASGSGTVVAETTGDFGSLREMSFVLERPDG